MKVHGVQASPERRILLGMLVNDAVCGRIASRWEEEGLFKTKMGNTLGGMAVDYYSRYGKAPLHNIEAIARSWAEGKSDDLVDELDGFLRTVDYEKLAKTCNADYVIDQAAEYFSQVKLQRLFDAGSGFLLKGDTKKAQSLIDGFLPVEMGTGSWIDPLSDDEAIRRVFEQDRDSLITFPDGLGKFFGRSLKRDALVAMMGAAKRGKSWLLLNIVFMAILQKRKVAYFECGDLTQDEVIERLLTRMAGRPLVINGDATRYTYKIPKTLQVDKGRVMIDYIEKTVKRSLTFEKLKEIRDRFREEYEADKLLRLSVHSTSSLSIPAMRTILSRWEREGWSPDCIASGQKVLTKRGLVNIEEIRGSDRLWDGVQWVSHGGLVYKGLRDVITYAGVTATPDHLVYSESGWRTLESCRRLRLRLQQTGSGGSEVRIGQGNLIGCQRKNWEIQKRQGHTAKICQCMLHQMRQQEMVPTLQFAERHNQRMPLLSSTQAVPDSFVYEVGRGQTTLHQFQKQGLEKVRRQRGYLQVQGYDNRLFVGGEASGTSSRWGAIGQNQQRWSLRAGEFTVVNTKAELFSHKETRSYSEDTQIQATFSRCEVCGRHLNPHVLSPDDSAADSGEMESVCVKRGAKTEVWDIVNAGPLHRFTVQGVLVHNCIVIDYADILAPPIKNAVESRDQINATWKMMSKMRQELHCLVVTATQADADSYDADILKRSNFTDDRRKHDHVTAMLGINQTSVEKERGIYRLNWLDRRGEAYSEREVCYTAGCLDIADPFIKSWFKEE